ncbi:MAG: SDR family NAD(P)-dependent oxidoreductase, partial [Methyloceanibacter sp.]
MSKTILITGAGSGLGQGTAIGLARKGHKVIAAVENWPQVSGLLATAKEAGV